MPSPSIHREIHPIYLISLLFLAFLLFNPSTSADTVTPTQSIADGQTLVSAGKVFELGFFSPDNSSSRYIGIWYRDIQGQTVGWVANRESPLHDSSGVLNLTSDGNLNLFDHTGHVFWSTNTSSSTEPSVQLLDSGNLVLTDTSNGVILWQSFDHPSDVLLSGMKIGWDSRTNLNRQLTSWKSPSDPSPGPYIMEIRRHGIPELVIWNGSTLMFRTGPWNGQGFGGFPVRSYNLFEFQLIDNQSEVSFSFEMANKSSKSITLLKSTGVYQRLLWQSNKEGWSIFWSYPADKCDYYGQCGSFGVCDRTSGLSCECLPGFEEDSALRKGSGGCVRRTVLDCRNGDGFKKLSGVKVPDTLNSSVNASLVFEECQDWCLRNCSCLAFAVNGYSGCMIWVDDLIDIVQYLNGGDDLYIRLAASELDSTKGDFSKKGNKKKKKLMVILILIFGILLLALPALYLWKKKRREGSTTNDYHNDDFNGKELELPLFNISSIESATSGFSAKNKLGEGGFGPVYKGMLEDGQEIAVKRLSHDSRQGVVEFKNEVMLIAKLQHKNLVRLLGCCIQGEERMLIYEYMPNKSLDAFIFDEAGRAQLDWHKRLDIVLGIARGLLYLHEDSRLKIIHRDLKASNILLDKDLIPKISDFGIARIFGGDRPHENTMRVVGTYGYMSPEYAMDGIFSVKSDVFSFGVIILEILSGKKNRVIFEANTNMNLLGHAWRLWREDKCSELLDDALEFPDCEHLILRCMQVGLLCVQEGMDDRPTMSSVVLMLGSEDMPLPQPKRPGFCTRIAGLDYDSSSTNPSFCTTNEITTTLLKPR